MADFPDIEYTLQNYTVEPMVRNTVYSSNNTRQRKMMTKRDDIFEISMRLDETELAVFETFALTTINGGEDTFNFDYYVGDVAQVGTGLLVNGEYQVSYVSNNNWDITCQIELKDRDLSQEEGIYNLINGLSGFETAYSLFDALEDMINNNTL